jgi:hypothetical protein
MKRNTTTTASIETVPGQGQSKPCGEEQFKAIKDGLQEVRNANLTDIWTRRHYAEQVRYCLWDGQHPDGRKHDLADGPAAFPFDKASDARVRTADFIIRLTVATLKLAARRGNVRIAPTEATASPLASHIQTWCSHILNNLIGHEWRFELERWLNWTHGDSPAVSLLHVTWERETRVRLVEFGIEDFLEYLVTSGVPIDEAAIDNIESLVTDPAREDELLSALLQRFPTLKPATVRGSIKTLREQGRASFPEPYTHRNQPRIEAQRIWQDVFVPSATRHPDRCRVIYKRAWYTQAEVLAMQESGEWTPDFCTQLLTKAGKSVVPENLGLDNWTTNTDTYNRPAPETKNLYEVICAYTRSATDDGVNGIFVLPFSYYIDTPAADLRLLDYPHGDFPFVWYVREVTTENLLDSRGISELVTTDQSFLKILRDLSSDHAQLASLPPFFSDSLITERDLKWKPLGLIRKRRQEKIEPAVLPPLPQNTLEMQDRILQSVANYFGMPIVEINAIVQQVLTQDLIEDYLDVLKQVIRQILQLSIEYATPAEIQRVTKAKPEEFDIELLRESILTLPDIQISFAAESFNLEYVQTVGQIIRDILLTIDTDQTIIRAEAVDYLARLLSPTLANQMLRSVEAANQMEEKDEEANFAKIMSGVEPPMAEDGQDFRTRYATLQRILQSNPALLSRIPDDARAILDARLEHLENQIQQTENAQIGRQLGQLALSTPQG